MVEPDKACARSGSRLLTRDSDSGVVSTLYLIFNLESCVIGYRIVGNEGVKHGFVGDGNRIQCFAHRHYKLRR
jgi:hypothetical protein